MRPITIIPDPDAEPGKMAEALDTLRDIEGIFGYRFVYHYAFIGETSEQRFQRDLYETLRKLFA